jgi:NAD(P)-dependent dehydrogenase (short-subunit alcohol dehydrogenase family)
VSFNLNVTDKIVVITGGGGLLGRSFAKKIVSLGGTAVLADTNFKFAQKYVEEIQTSNPNGEAYAVEMDITSKDSIQSSISDISSRFGKIDALVNNAYPRNKNYGRKFEDVEYSDFCENINLHLGGYFLVSQQFAKYFSEKKVGHIITISSIYGLVSPRFDIYENTHMTMPVEYAVIKSALLHLNKYLTNLYKKSGIRFNCISPGGIFDNQPSEFINNYNKYAGQIGMLEPDNISNVLLFLISDLASAINGENITVDDGWSL